MDPQEKRVDPASRGMSKHNTLTQMKSSAFRAIFSCKSAHTSVDVCIPITLCSPVL